MIVFQKGMAAYVHQIGWGSTRTVTLEMEKKQISWRAMWERDSTGLCDCLDVGVREREREVSRMTGKHCWVAGSIYC